MEIENVEIQERVFKIYKPFISCSVCLRNLNQEQMKRGRYIKNYCNYFKEPLVDPYDSNYDIQVDRNKAANCPYWLPGSMHIAADLSYIYPESIENLTIEIEKTHADRLNQLFNENQITK